MKQKFKKQFPVSGLALLLAIVFSSFTAINLEAQNSISGVVKDAGGMPIPGVSVVQKGTTTGTYTDFDGNYSIELTLGEEILVFSYVGFKTQEIQVNGQTTINVTLEEDVASLDEVVVIGYGTQKKESVVAAITQIKGEELMERNLGVANVEQALQGNLPGVTAIQGSGVPGEDNLKIYIRGKSSWNTDGDPLVLVDGVRRSMNDIDMNDIENLSVLKDASATAVFGVEGANGVILITTKRGQTGKAQLSLSVNTTIKAVSQLPEKLNSYDALLEANSAILRGIAVAPNTWNNYTPLDIVDRYRNPASLEESYIYPNVDWEDELLKDYAQDYRINLSVRGGNKTAKYFGSLAYQTVEDIFDGGRYDNGRGYLGEYRYDRFNFRSNIDFNITNTTELSVSLAGFYGVRENPGNLGNVTNGLYLIAPSLYTPIYPDGLYGNPFSYFNVYNNPVEQLQAKGYTTFRQFQVNTDFILKQKLDFITEGLSFQGRFSLDNNQRSRQSLSDGGVIYRVYDGNGQEEILIPDSNTRFGYVRPPWTLGNAQVEDGQRNRQLVYDASLNYNKTFNEKHNLTGLFLFRRQERTSGTGIFAFPTYREDWVGRVTYNYDSRYFLDINGAYNGSEQFGRGFRFDLFPSVALGWTLSNEAFMENVDWLNLLKFRGSYGLIGDDSFIRNNNVIGRWNHITQWNSSGSAYLVPSAYQGLSPYTFFRESIIGNPNLQWEEAVKYNIGAEFNLFNGLLTGEIDYFAEDRSKIVIVNALIPDFVGASPPLINKGIVEIRGYEIVLGSSYTFDNGLTLSGDFNFTQAIDEVIVRDDPALRAAYLNDAGFNIGQGSTAIPAGILTSWDDIYSSTPLNENQGTVRPGYYDLVDFDGDGIYNSNFDNAPFGYPNQPQRSWGLTLGARYEGFSISAQLYGTQNASRLFSNQTFSNSTPLIFEQDLDYWTVNTPNNTDTQPSFGVPGATNPRDNWLDASLTRLRTVSLSYDIPRETCEKLGLKKLQFFANGNNLFLWSNLPDDREFNTSGETRSRGDYPTLKTFNFGFNMNF
ncbi:SusC/RagA family TonB-linked outer membrane protein [Winogradskyella sp. R77965]|uniref:SusC/RagA family TonB-linked outer membrane protein n=1 Tax=Winogradskyella sp. R77965 TaxID=3093872 RepID=UPI0037DDB7B1